MIAVKDSSPALQEQAPVRPLDVTRDLHQVANLIELCFSASMDPDGKEYLRQMRRMARDASFLRWATQLADHTSMPVSGYVWEEQGRITGNLSLIPMWKNNRRIFLIANVAVHPDFRRHGIARALTQAALEYAKAHGGWSAWLQVREDNQAALNLYLGLGFTERTRRTTWQTQPSSRTEYLREKKVSDQNSLGFAIPSPGPSQHQPGPDPIIVTPRYPSDWPIQEQWLNKLYPAEITWNLPFHLASFRPDVWHGLLRFLKNDRIHHWAARVNGELAGLLTWQPTSTFADTLWLAVPSDQNNKPIRSLLAHAREQLSPHRALSLNLPAGSWQEVYEEAGFSPQHTLIWMEATFRNKIEIKRVERSPE